MGNGSRLPSYLIERARDTDVVNVLERHGVSVRLKRSGAERIGSCPRCAGTDRFAVCAKGDVQLPRLRG